MFTSGYFLAFILIASIAMVMLLTIKYRMHPFIAMLMASFFVAFTLYVPLETETPNYITDVSTLIGKGFGYTLGSIGIIILLGSIIGTILEMSGAALKMGEVVIRLVGKTHPALAMNMLGFIVAIPVFCDSGYLILTPLRKAIAKKSSVSPVALSIALSTGLYASHVLIPPTPGPTIMVAEFGLQSSLFTVILIGFIVAIPTSLAGLLYGIFISKYIKKSDDNKKTSISYETFMAEFDGLPSAWKSFLPIFLPIFLMSVGSVARFDLLPLNFSWFINLLIFLGDPATALFLGFLCSLLLVKGFEKETLSMWISEGVHNAGTILAIAGASGAFAEVLKSTDITVYISNLGGVFTSMNMGLLVPFVVASIIKLSLGSSTIAIVTASTLFAPLLIDLGFVTHMSQILVMMSIGSGAMIASHANDSYFWIVVELSGLSVHDAYKARTLATVVQGLVAMSVVLILSNFLI